jgi:hypothetical protein
VELTAILPAIFAAACLGGAVLNVRNWFRDGKEPRELVEAVVGVAVGAFGAVALHQLGLAVQLVLLGGTVLFGGTLLWERRARRLRADRHQPLPQDSSDDD